MIHLRELVGQHDDRIPDLDFRVPDLPFGSRDAHDFRGSERLLIKIEGIGGTLNNEIGRCPLYPSGIGFTWPDMDDLLRERTQFV